jgi:hypothetical protein
MTTKTSKPETSQPATIASATAQATSPGKRRSKKDDTPYVPPKRLSKAAIFLREHGPLCKIVDMRAVMK